MILKKKFIDKLAITQGRHLKIINNKIQLFPDKLWKQELKLFNKTNLKFVEWVVSKDNFSKNPICKINGYKIINNHLKKNNLKCRSIDLDFIVKENPLNYSEKKWVDSIYTSLSLEEKVSQLFINWVSPEQSDFDTIRKLVEEDKIGGLIFSIGTTNTHIEWLNRFQSLAKTPLLVTMDAEWGPSQRLSDVFAHPWNMTLGAIQDSLLVRDISKRMAEQNKALGIHYNFSPSVDVNNNSKNPIIGNRSFGENPINVYEKAKAYILGHKDAGIFTSIKHFPGHGDTDKDSHKTLPVIKGDINRLNSVELYPFKRLIEDGLAESVMLAHLSVPALDKKYPSSLSYKTVNNLLRDKYGFP